MIKEVKNDDLLYELGKYDDQKVIIVFTGKECQHCNALLDSLSKVDEGVDILNVNVDHNQTLQEEYDIRKLPTSFIYKNGVLVLRAEVTDGSRLISMYHQL